MQAASMDDLRLLLLTLCLFLASWFLLRRMETKRLPPGPLHIPVLSPILWLRRSLSDLQPVVRRLSEEHGPIFTVRLASSRPTIFIADRGLAHDALVHNGAIFSGRVKANQAVRILNTNQHSINSASYGPLWRLLRRNLTSGILQPSRIKHFGNSRRWVLDILFSRLRARAEADGGVVVVMESFQYAMFHLLVLMCFGEKMDPKTVEDIEAAQRKLLVSFSKFSVFSFFPEITKIVFRRLWNEVVAIRRRQDELFVPLIRARRGGSKHGQQRQEDDGPDYAYVDSLFDVRLQEDGGRELTEGEMVSLCYEFLNAGTDTTATTLQWVMAEIVRNQGVQRKLVDEIQTAVEAGTEIREEDLQRMPYLKAVILEGLRRHPPGHFVLPHTVTEDVTLKGHRIPKDTMVNFAVADMGWDEKVWTSPMEFRPERFMPGGEGEDVDLTGSRVIKMMPFGVGRRMCPGMGLAMLHLQYFLGNLVREFEWKPVEGEEVDLSVSQEFTVVMKHPLRARITQRMAAD